MPDRQSPIVIRAAKLEEAEALAAAQRRIAQTPGRLASRPHELVGAAFAERIARLSQSQSGAFVVADLAGEVVGQAVLDPLKLAVTAHVVDLTLAVHEGYQGRGIGRRLLSHLIEWAERNPNIERIELRVRSGNAAAIHLYQALGFVEEGRLRRRIKLGPGHYLDDIVMGRWVAGDA